MWLILEVWQCYRIDFHLANRIRIRWRHLYFAGHVLHKFYHVSSELRSCHYPILRCSNVLKQMQAVTVRYIISTWAKWGGIWTDAWICLHYWVVIRVAGYFNFPLYCTFHGGVIDRIQYGLKVVFCLRHLLPPIIITSNGSWRQGIKCEMTCTVYVALVWNIIYWIIIIIIIIIIWWWCWWWWWWWWWRWRWW